MVIIAATLLLLLPLLTKSTPDLASAQGIFAILGGWGGIIIGYYFGRLPSEKAADTASKVANTATQVASTANQAAETSQQQTETAKQAADIATKAATEANLIAEKAKLQTAEAEQTKLGVISECTNFLENTASQLKQLPNLSADMKTKKGLTAESMDSLGAEIENQIIKINAEIKKLKSLT